MDKLWNHIKTLLLAEKGYTALFKAGIVLVSAALMAMSQTCIFLYEKDISAHKAKFTLETSLKQSLEKIDCSKLTNQQLDCLMAKHEMSTLNSFLELLDIVVKMGFWFGVLLTSLSCVCFLCSPFLSTSSNVNDKQV